MNELETAGVFSLLEKAGMLDEVANKSVNGTEKENLGWYDESDTSRAVVCAAFHVLGQELLAQCEPMIATIIAGKLVELRNGTIDAMKVMPK